MKISSAVSKRVLSGIETGLDSLVKLAEKSQSPDGAVIVVCEDQYGFLRFEVTIPDDVRKADTVIWTPKAAKKPAAAK